MSRVDETSDQPQTAPVFHCAPRLSPQLFPVTYLNRRLGPFTALKSWTGILFTAFNSWTELHLNRGLPPSVVDDFRAEFNECWEYSDLFYQETVFDPKSIGVATQV